MVYGSVGEIVDKVGSDFRKSLSVRPDYETVAIVDVMADVASRVGYIVWSDPVSAVLTWIDCDDVGFDPPDLSGLDLDLWEIDQTALYATSKVAERFGLSDIPIGGEVTVGELRSAWDSTLATEMEES